MNTENNYTETDLGNVAPNPRGEFSEAEEYEYLDYVFYKGGSYLCLAELGTTIVGFPPEPGKTTQYWQAVALPGGLTPEYVAMHDRVVNLSEQVSADTEEVRESKENIEGMETNVENLQSQSVQSAQEAEESKTQAAGYASAAEASRQAAAESEANVNAQVTGFDTHVSEKTESAEADIEAARIAANAAVVAQQESSVQEVKNKTSQYITEKQTEAEKAIETKAQEYATSVDADIQAVKDAGTTQVGNVNTAGDAQVQNVNTAGTTQIEAVNTAGSAQKKAVEDAGQEALNNIGTGVDSSLTQEGKAADAAATGKAVDELKGDLTVEQTAREEADNALRADLIANANADAVTKRSLDALWKLNQGISYQFETDDAEIYQKTVPFGAKIASVHKIGGRTILWNQRVKADGSETTDNGITYTNSNGIITVKGVATDVSTSRLLSIQNPYFVAGHKYLILGCPKGGARDKYMIDTGAGIGLDIGEGKIGMCSQTGYFYYAIYVYPDAGAVDLIFKPQLFDLTDMFGAGSEPASVEEFHSMFPDEYYPYNPNELKPIPVNEIVNSKADETVISTTEIPTGIIALDGYGVGNGTVYNYVDFENKQFVKRCEIVDGEVVEVEEPVITDISGLIGDTFQMPLTVEAGGTLTFQNANGDGYRVPVPSNIEYIVSLAEVNN